MVLGDLSTFVERVLTQLARLFCGRVQTDCWFDVGRERDAPRAHRELAIQRHIRSPASGLTRGCRSCALPFVIPSGVEESLIFLITLQPEIVRDVSTSLDMTI